MWYADEHEAETQAPSYAAPLFPRTAIPYATPQLPGHAAPRPKRRRSVPVWFAALSLAVALGGFGLGAYATYTLQHQHAQPYATAASVQLLQHEIDAIKSDNATVAKNMQGRITSIAHEVTTFGNQIAPLEAFGSTCTAAFTTASGPVTAAVPCKTPGAG